MKWMEIAWAQVGVAETAGPTATPEIVAMFRDAGRPDVTSDEIAWCGALAGACLSRAGVRLAMTPERRLLARAYLEQGTPLTEPRLEAIVVLRRPEGGPTAGHVGFVTGWDGERVHVLGGNQANAVSVRSFARADVLGYRWPLPPATPADLDAAGSTTTQLALRQQKDAAKGTTAGTSGQLVPVPKVLHDIPAPADVVADLGAVKQMLDTAQAFAAHVQVKWPWVAVGIAGYYGARMLYSGWLIRQNRTADHNSGANTGREALPKETPG